MNNGVNTRNSGGGTLLTKRFLVADLFDVSRAYGFDKGYIVLSSHGTEFIGRTETNNGVQGFYDNPLVVPNEANTISISQIGAQTAQYRANPWYASQNLFKLMPTFVMNKLHALFMIAVINKQLSVYSGYANFPKGEDIRNIELELPVTNDGIPDYNFMQTFIKSQEKLLMQRLDKFRQLQIDTTKAVI